MDRQLIRDNITLSKARPIDFIKLIHFYKNLEKDIETRKYYRFLPFYSIKSIIKSLFYLISTAFIPFLYNKRLFFLALHDGKIIGVCHIEKIGKSNIGIYGIAILRDYRRLKISKVLSIYALNYAIKIGKLRLIMLSVDYDNTVAISLYKKLGFKFFKYIDECDYRYVSKEKIGCYQAFYKGNINSKIVDK